MRYKNTQEAMWGKEPSVEPLLETDSFEAEFSKVLAWYQNNTTDTQRRDWFLEWLNDASTEKRIRSLRNSEFTTAGICARLVLRGVENSYLLNKLQDYALKFLELSEGSPWTTEDEGGTTKSKVDLRYQQIRDELELMFDKLIQNKFSSEFSMVNWIKSFNPSPAHLVRIREDYTKLLNEVRLSFTDPYFKEAYSNFTTPQKKRMVEVLEEIASAKKERKQRVVRKKKTKPVEVLLAKVTCAFTDEENNLTGHNPKKVLGASCVLTWNKKYRIINYLESTPGTTLSIKGTTIQNVDEKKSFSKKIRKPSEVLPRLVSGGKIACRKELQDLTTNDGSATGRLGEETLILKVF